MGEAVLGKTTQEFKIVTRGHATADIAFVLEMGWREMEIAADKEYPIRGLATVDSAEYFVVLVPAFEGQTYGLLVSANDQISEHIINFGYTEPSAWMLLGGIGGQLAAGWLMLGSFEVKPEPATLTPIFERINLADLPDGSPQ
ncbi:MAG: hypothetical protein ACI9JM_000286 [Halioglobus sp.]